RLLRSDLLRVSDELNGVVDQVLGDVIPLVRGSRRFDPMIVVDELGIVLVGFSSEKAVVAVESAAERPTIVGPSGADLVVRGEMPFANGVGAIAVALQDLGKKTILEWDLPVVSRIASGALGDAGHSVRMVVASGEN